MVRAIRRCREALPRLAASSAPASVRRSIDHHRASALTGNAYRRAVCAEHAGSRDCDQVVLNDSGALAPRSRNRGSLARRFAVLTHLCARDRNGS